MVRLALMMYAIAATMMMGAGVVTLLVMNKGTPGNLLLAVAGGLVLGAPAAWLVAKSLLRGQPTG